MGVVGFYRGDDNHLDPQPLELDSKTAAPWLY